MNKDKSAKPTHKKRETMLPEYDFSSGIRGKHSREYSNGHEVTIHKTDGTKEVQYFTLEEGAVMLESDVRKYFPDSTAVNAALRGLIALLPKASARNIR